MILAISGACRSKKQYNTNIQKIFIAVKIPHTKTNVQRTLTVTNRENTKIYIIKNFTASTLSQIFACIFELVVKEGIIENWLNIRAIKSYKLYKPLKSLCRTSAILILKGGVNVLGLKRHEDQNS